MAGLLYEDPILERLPIEVDRRAGGGPLPPDLVEQDDSLEISPVDNLQPRDFQLAAENDATSSSPLNVAALPGLGGVEQPPRQDPIHLENFAALIRHRLIDRCKGWAFVVTRHGQIVLSDHMGDARSPADGNVPMKATTRLNIASASKTITATAVLRLLRQPGRTAREAIREKIAPHLPSAWSRGTGVDELTFEDLLCHESGFKSRNADFPNTLSFAALRSMVDLGTGHEKKYLNANYALFRVIIPHLWFGIGNASGTTSALMYRSYIRQEIFGRMQGNISENASTAVHGTHPTLYYIDKDDPQGVLYGDWTEIAGGGGWHLSARELAAFLAFITFTDDILVEEERQLMDDLSIGWNERKEIRDQLYLGHGGSIGKEGESHKSVRTGVAKLPFGYGAALVANSVIEGSSPLGILFRSFDEART